MIGASGGASTKDLQEQLGHSSQTMALHYTHAAEEASREATNRLGDLVAQRRAERAAALEAAEAVVSDGTTGKVIPFRRPS
jgi:hypothetical protein